MLPANWKGLASVVLLASLAANVFFISAAAGLWMQEEREDWRNRPRGPAAWFERQLGEDAPPELIQAAREVFTRRQQELQSAREQVWSSREEVAMVIGAEPFDLTAFQAAVAESAEARAERSRIFNDIVQELVTSLDENGRRAMAEALKVRIAERRKRRERRQREQEQAQ